MQEVCYLCGLPITADQEKSDDHVIPETLIRRAQPKVKGFDYGHFLPTHTKCNNEFGPETYVAKALDLLSVLNSPDAGGALQHRQHESITILPIDASKLSHFTQRDLAYFKLIDARRSDIESMSNPNFYAGHQKTNPTRSALTTVLSVLAKSAAALLVKRYFRGIPPIWRIYVQAYSGDLTDFDLADILGENKPFDKELRAWVVELPNNNWHVIFAANDTLVFFTFAFSDRNQLLREIKDAHPDAHTLRFVGTSLNELLVAGWHEV